MASSSLSIIGHGPSPKGRGWGQRIDENTVIRLKNPSWQNAEDYGKRTDYMAASTETMPIMLEYKAVPIEYLAQPKKGSWSSITESNFRAKTKIPLRIPIDVHNHWNPIFRGLSTMMISECPNHSLGMAAITYACEFLKPAEILLVGFDNMLDPGLLEYHKADRGRWVTRHDWPAENRMLGLVGEHYGVEIHGFE